MEEMMSTIDVNLSGLVRCSRLAFEQMKKKDSHGYIININSVAGHRPLKSSKSNVYASSKYAVTAACFTMKDELIAMKNDKIRVTVSILKNFRKFKPSFDLILEHFAWRCSNQLVRTNSR